MLKSATSVNIGIALINEEREMKEKQSIETTAEKVWATLAEVSASLKESERLNQESNV